MKTLVRCVIAGAIAVALLAASLLLILGAPVESDMGSGVVFASAEPVDVQSVTVVNQTGTYSFYFEGDGYVLDDIPPAIVDLDAFIAFMTNCAKLSATRRIADGDPVAYGLAEPAATADIQFFDGKTLKLRIGDAERISQNYYAAVDGFDGVFMLHSALAEQFLLPKTQIISRLVTPPLAVSSPLSAVRDITFTGGSLRESVTIHATADADTDLALEALSFGSATHLVRGASVYQLDQTYGVEVLGSLFGIPAIDVTGYNLNADELAAFGFGDPYMTIEYDLAGQDARHMRLLLAKIDDARFYATLDGSGAVYVIGREAFIDIDFGKLPLRWFLTPLLMDVSSVTVESPDASYRFDIDNTDARNPVVTHGGQALDTALFRSFFRLVTSAANDGSYLGTLAPPDGEPLLSITYEYANPDKRPDTLALYPGGARRANVFVNGAGEFAMKDLFAERVLEGCANLTTGNPIEENW